MCVTSVAVYGQGLFFPAEGRLLVILLHESCIDTYFLALIFVLCGNRFIKAIRYER